MIIKDTETANQQTHPINTDKQTDSEQTNRQAESRHSSRQTDRHDVCYTENRSMLLLENGNYKGVIHNKRTDGSLTLVQHKSTRESRIQTKKQSICSSGNNNNNIIIVNL